MTSIKKGMDISCVCVSVSFNSSHLRVRPLCNSKEDFVRAHLQLWSDGSTAFTLPQSAFSLSCACVVAAALPSRRGNPCWCSGHAVGEGGLRGCKLLPRRGVLEQVSERTWPFTPGWVLEAPPTPPRPWNIVQPTIITVKTGFADGAWRE